MTETITTVKTSERSKLGANRMTAYIQIVKRTSVKAITSAKLFKMERSCGVCAFVRIALQITQSPISGTTPRPRRPLAPVSALAAVAVVAAVAISPAALAVDLFAQHLPSASQTLADDVLRKVQRRRDSRNRFVLSMKQNERHPIIFRQLFKRAPDQVLLFARHCIACRRRFGITQFRLCLNRRGLCESFPAFNSGTIGRDVPRDLTKPCLKLVRLLQGRQAFPGG